jgi:hypothetical protein
MRGGPLGAPLSERISLTHITRPEQIRGHSGTLAQASDSVTSLG